MNISYVLDVSVVVKWFARDNEEHLRQAEQLFRDIQKGTVAAYAPDFLLIELSNALLAGKSLTPEEVKSCCTILGQSAIRFLPITSDLLYSAIDHTHSDTITVYDALYVALAEIKQCRVVTADKKLGKRTILALPLEHYRKENGTTTEESS